MENKNSLEAFNSMPVYKAVIKNVIPAMVAMLMVLFYNLADTFFIGQTHDAYQVAAVSLATPVFLMFMAVGTVFGIGGTSVISRAIGEGRSDYAKKVCSFCMWSCVIVGITMSALFIIFMEQILSLIGASKDTWDLARIYLTIVSLSGPFVLISNCYANILRAEGVAQARILEADGEKEAIQRIINALADKGQPDKYLIAMKYLETMQTITSGQNNKVVYMPYEATGILSSVDGIKQMLDANK